MKYSEAKQGRIFILRLEDGEIIHEIIEKFALDHNIKAASIVALGAIDKDSKLILGPEEDRAEKIIPVIQDIQAAHEVTGTGTLFPNSDGAPVLHMHLACGSKNSNYTGCVRKGIKVWHILEVVITEITNTDSIRELDESMGFELLSPK